MTDERMEEIEDLFGSITADIRYRCRGPGTADRRKLVGRIRQTLLQINALLDEFEAEENQEKENDK